MFEKSNTILASEKSLACLPIKRARFTWQQRKANDDLRYKYNIPGFKKSKASKIKSLKAKLQKKKVKSVLVNECTIEETFPQISIDTLEFI